MSRVNEGVKLRRNQVWVKRDTGQMIVLQRKEEGNAWATMRLNKGSSKKKAHHICEHDIKKFYQLI